MSFLSIFDAVTPVINKVLDFIPDPAQKLAAQQQIMTSLQAWDAQQAAVDAEEAKNSSVFVSGWRPFIGWICGGGFAYHLILQPILSYSMAIFGHTFPLPVFDTATLNDALMGMLGLGGLRTYEKVQGIADK